VIAEENSGGYVLHSRPWRETSLILELFTREEGRIAAVMRSARKVQGRSPTRPQPFQHYEWQLTGRRELKNLSQLELAGRPRTLPPQRLAIGFYLNELLMRALSRMEAMPRLYDAYDQALALLADQNCNLFGLSRNFEQLLLQELGAAPAWLVTVEGEAVDLEGIYYLDPESGVSNVSSNGAKPVRGVALHALDSKDYSEPSVRREVRDVMAFLLQPHIGTAPLKSRELWLGTR